MNKENNIKQESFAAILKDVYFSYDSGKTWILNGINLKIKYGERVVIVGLNGSGKSTLSKILSGLIAPDSGFVQLCGNKVFDLDHADSNAYKIARKSIGTLFQNPEDQIITTISEDDIAFGLENLCVKQSNMNEMILNALESVHMENHRYDDPSDMSGGQQQKIALASTIVTKPKLLIFDEPTSMLDYKSLQYVNSLFDDLQKRGFTIVHITHKFDECVNADRILLVNKGKIRDISSNELKEYYKNAIDNEYAKKCENQHNKEKCEEKEKDKEKVQHDEKNQDLLQNQANDETFAIEVSNLNVSYSKLAKHVINNYSLKVKHGEIVAITGENGSGKSTLAKTICGLLKYDSGSVLIQGIPLNAKENKTSTKKLRQTIGYVMQCPEQQLFAQTVFEDVSYGPKNFGLEGEELNTKVNETLKMLHIEHLAQFSPFELSGGQQRLVAIAGVLAYNPKILVLDEPSAGLDFESSMRLRKILEDLHKKGITIVLITHDMNEAKDLKARIITIKTEKDDESKKSAIKENRHFTGNAHSSSTSPSYSSSTSSFLSSFDPRVTLISCFILIFSAFRVTNYSQLGILSIATLILTIFARIQFSKLISFLHILISIFIFSSILNIFIVKTGRILFYLFSIPITLDGVNFTILFSTRLSLAMLIGLTVILTFTPTRLTQACASIISPLKIFKLPTQEIAFIMTLALRFLPTLSKEAKAVSIAQTARGGSIKNGSLKKRLQAMTSLIVPGFAGVIRHAYNLGLALDSRCYIPQNARTHFHVLKIRTRDIALAIFSIIITILIAKTTNIL